MYEKDSYITFESYEEYESGEEMIVSKQEGEEKECEFKREIYIVEERVEEKKDVEVMREDKELARLDVRMSDMTVIQIQGNYITHTGEDGDSNSCVINKQMKNV